MIRLDPQYITTQSSSFNGQTHTQVTDTLFISSVRIDFSTGAMYATIQSGSGTPFDQTLDPFDVCVNPDGTFISSNGTWEGIVAAAPTLVAQLKATFDQFILASGKVTGQMV
jgi:hypothetical protein